MKNFFRLLSTGKDSGINVLLVLSLFIVVGFGCKSNRSDSTPNVTTTTTNTTNTTISSGPSTSTTATPATTPAVSADKDLPSPAAIESLIKGTMTDFADAVDQGDFADFHRSTSKDFQATYTADQLNTTFKPFIDQKERVLPSFNGVPATSPNYTDGPRIRTEKGYKIMVANGSFPTSPNSVQFETEYELEKGNWKILKIRIKM